MQNPQTYSYNPTIYKTIAIICACISFLTGALYLSLLYIFPILPSNIPIISYPSSIGFMLVGLGLLSLYSFSYWSRVIGALLSLLCIFQYIQLIISKRLISIPFHSNPLTLYGLSLLGLFFLIWKRKNTSQWHYLYGFCAALIGIGCSFLGLVSYAIHFSVTKNNINIINIISVFLLIVSCFGALSALIYFVLLNKIKLYKWLPLLAGLALLNFAAILSFGLYLNTQVTSTAANVLIGYAFFGGLLFSILISCLFYFFLLSREHLQQIQMVKKQLDTIKEREELALQQSKTATWQWNIQKNEIICDEIGEKIFGIAKGEFPKTIENFANYIHPNDREHLKRALECSIKTGIPYEETYRITWPDHSTHFIYAKANISLNEAKEPTLLSGIAMDVTKDKYAQQFLKLSEQTAKILGKTSSLKEACIGLSSVLHDIFGWDALIIWVKQRNTETFTCAAFDFPNQITYLKEHLLFDLDIHHPLKEKLSKSLQVQILPNIGESNYFPSWQAPSTGGIFIPIVENNTLEAIMGILKQGPIESEIDPLFVNSLSLLKASLEEFIRKERAQMALQELAEIINALQLPIYSLEPDGIIITWNMAAEKIFGWLATEVIGKNIKELFSDFAQEEFQMVERVLKENTEISWVECSRNTKKGDLLKVQVSYSPFLDQEGKNRVIVSIHDVTKESLAREALHQSEEKFHAFVENTEEWIWEIDQKGIFIYSNPAVQGILGYPSEKIVGQSIYLFLPEHKHKEIQQELELHAEQKQGWRRQILLWKDILDKERILESTAWPILGPSQELLGFRGASLDITDRIAIEKTKNEFISIIGHEIKSPLTSIHGALGLLFVEKDLPKKAQDLLEIAYRNSQLLAELVQDIIDVEKIELGKFTFRLEDLPLDPLIHEAICSAKLMAKKCNITIIEEMNVPQIVIHIDRKRLLQVLHNLLSNAIKFSYEGGKIFVFTTVQGDHVRLSIKDEGEGIPKEFQSKIFGRFEQAYIPLSKEKKGTGLGLSIAKMLIEQMGGTIGFISEPEKGSTFYFDLPIVHKADNS